MITEADLKSEKLSQRHIDLLEVSKLSLAMAIVAFEIQECPFSLLEAKRMISETQDRLKAKLSA